MALHYDFGQVHLYGSNAWVQLRPEYQWGHDKDGLDLVDDERRGVALQKQGRGALR